MEEHYESESLRHWNRLHTLARFRPRYPLDHVVRFLMSNFPEERRRSLKALDIGVGGGRHIKLLCELGFLAFGIDISDEGLQHCRDWLGTLNYEATLKQASMSDLPFPDNAFDVAISCGVFYYADSAGMQKAIGELHRVLAPGALALVLTRTTDDYRYGKGILLEDNTFRLTIEDTNECGTVGHFLGESDVPAMFSSFSDVRFEKTETTFNERQSVNSDWLITVRK